MKNHLNVLSTIATFVFGSVLALTPGCAAGGKSGGGGGAPPEEVWDESDSSSDSSSSGSSSSKSSSSSSTSGSSSSSGSSKSSSSSTGGAQCVDSDDAGETEDKAMPLKDVSDTDSDAENEVVSGVISGPTDVDWYTYKGTDSTGPSVDPTRTIEVENDKIAYQLCKFVKCKSGTFAGQCPDNTTPATSKVQKLKGCCASSTAGSFTIAPSALSDLCDGTSNDDATIFIRVDNPLGNACGKYTLHYHY